MIFEILKQKSLVFAFQANIYCCLLSIIFNFNLITRSNSSPSGWSQNILKNIIFKILFKIPKKIIVNSKDFKSEINKKFNIKSELIYNPLNQKTIEKKAKKNLTLIFLKIQKSRQSI